MLRMMICLLMFTVGCVSKTTQQKYVDHINDPDNKIVQRISIGGVTATAKWLPPDYRRLMNKEDNKNQAGGEQDAFYYFNVKFDKREGTKPDKNKTLYLDFDMEKDFVLARGSDSILPAICQKIENGIGGSYEYLLAFEKDKSNKSTDGFNLVYQDKIFGIGTIMFVYKQEDINKIPGLNKETIQ